MVRKRNDNEHSHETHRGNIVEEEMKLAIGAKTKIYKKGDSYFIPKGVIHSAVFNKKTWAIDYFSDKERYKIKTN